MDAGFPCDKTNMLGAVIKETPCNINTFRSVNVHGSNLHLVVLTNVCLQ